MASFDATASSNGGGGVEHVEGRVPPTTSMLLSPDCIFRYQGDTKALFNVALQKTIPFINTWLMIR